MATPAEAAAYRRAQADLVALARADLRAFWRTLDFSDARAAAAAIETFMVELSRAYGSAAAGIAADRYDELRAGAGVRRSYRARMAEPAPPAQIASSARWGARPLFAEDPDPAKALSLLTGTTQRLVQQPGRLTISGNVDRDPARPRWARSPSGKTCAFCLMLASRGAVYRTEEGARFAKDGDKYHDDCDCQPEPVFRDEDELSYDPSPLYDAYVDARNAAGSGDPKVIAAQLRRDLGVA